MSALTKVLFLNDARVNAMSVRGYIVVDTNAPRRTRSQKAESAVKFTTIPITAKIVSLLLKTWNDQRIHRQHQVYYLQDHHKS